MDVDDRSEQLFGRYQALRVYAAIARLAKAAFTTGELAKATSIPTPQLSKELGRLCQLGVIRSTSRRGDYERVELTAFWRCCDELATEWGHAE